jgi:DNA-binding HxlR family transcriptional regulator
VTVDLTRPRDCTVARALEVLGERWSLLVLRELFLGNRRFASIQTATGAPRAVLSARLERLVAEGLIETREYREEGQRTRHEYVLTEKGRDLQPVVTALRQWGDKYFAGPEGPEVLLRHRDCGEPVRVAIVCEAGHELPGTGREVQVVRREDALTA